MLKIKFIAFCLTLALLGAKSYAQPSIAWQRCYGGTGIDYFTDAQVTLDNGIISCITTGSHDGDLEGLDSAFGWVIKFDAMLELQWQQFYGNPDLAIIPRFATQLLDSSFAFYGFGGEGTNGFQGQLDFLLMKTDKYGNLLWHKSYGGPGLEDLDGFIATSDGGFLFTGQSTHAGGDIPFHYGDVFAHDANVIKTDSIGNIMWIRNLGGSGVDGCIGTPVETSPGKYQVHIYSSSDDYDLASCGIDAVQKRWVVQLNTDGDIEQETFYEAEENFLRSDGQTGIISGNRTLAIGSSLALSTLYPAPADHGGEEGAFGIFNSDLGLIDVKMFGGSLDERFYRYTRDFSGNYYFLGYSFSADGDLPNNYNNSDNTDYWILSTDSNFNKIWSRNFGGSYNSGEFGSTWRGDLVIHNNMIIAFLGSATPEELPDYDIVCGYTVVPYPTSIKSDAWMVAFEAFTSVENIISQQSEITIYPNPSSNMVNINLSSKVNTINCALYNTFGNVVSRFNFSQTSNCVFSVNNLPTGIYYVKIIINNNISFIHKLIVNH
jgi:hypothetical protein